MATSSQPVAFMLKSVQIVGVEPQPPSLTLTFFSKKDPRSYHYSRSLLFSLPNAPHTSSTTNCSLSMPLLSFQCFSNLFVQPHLPFKGCPDGLPPHMMPGRTNSSFPLPLYPEHYYSSSKSIDQTLIHELPRAKKHRAIFVSSG